MKKLSKLALPLFAVFALASCCHMGIKKQCDISQKPKCQCEKCSCKDCKENKHCKCAGKCACNKK